MRHTLRHVKLFVIDSYIPQKVTFGLCLKNDKMKKPLKTLRFQGFFVVRPTGFEPATFRVGV